MEKIKYLIWIDIQKYKIEFKENNNLNETVMIPQNIQKYSKEILNTMKNVYGLLWLHEINRRKWTWKFIIKIEWRLGLSVSPSSAKPLCVLGSMGREKKRKRVGDYGRKRLLLFLLEYPAGASIWGGAEHRCWSPWPGVLISHVNPRRQTLPVSFYF